MFWGLIMEPGRIYSQTVKASFRVSMAALDISSSSDDPVQVMCIFENRNYLLCTLNKKHDVQCHLDLNFRIGSKVAFGTNGKSLVHLTGYLTPEQDFFDEEEEEEEEENEPTLNSKKRSKKELTEAPPKKKTKVTGTNDVEEEDSSDSDFDIDKVLNANDSGEEEESDEEESGEEEEDDKEEGEEEELGEEETSSLSETEEAEAEPKQNGFAKNNLVLKVKKQQEKKQKEKTNDIPEEKKDQKKLKGKKHFLKGGVMIQDVKEGAGEAVKSGKFVHVYYEGRLKENNTLFDSATKGAGFRFRVGKGEVIKGWDIGLVGMKVGGKRRITCPPNVAYGPKGSPPVIPPNSTLVFDVELKKIT